MKITVQIKLLPSEEQHQSLLQTLELTNKACNRLSQLAWETKTFGQLPIQRRFYHQLRGEYPLSSQVFIRAIAKVAQAYKLDHASQRMFKYRGSIAYDSRILSIHVDKSMVSIWTLAKRQAIPFVCGEVQRKLLVYPKGESNLICRSGDFYLNISIDVPDQDESTAVDMLGVDLGIVNIAHDSDGNRYSGSAVNKVRHRNRCLRAKLQKKGTKSAKRLLKKRRRKESNFVKNTNHSVSKRIVQLAKDTGRGIALENLKGIRNRITARKAGRAQLHSWSFAQLGEFIRYKAKLGGVPVYFVDPRYTSQRCNVCGHVDKKNRKSQSDFHCLKCGHQTNADENGARNIRLKGLDMMGTGKSKAQTRRPKPTVKSVGVPICKPNPLRVG